MWASWHLVISPLTTHNLIDRLDNKWFHNNSDYFIPFCFVDWQEYDECVMCEGIFTVAKVYFEQINALWNIAEIYKRYLNVGYVYMAFFPVSLVLNQV